MKIDLKYIYVSKSYMCKHKSKAGSCTTKVLSRYNDIRSHINIRTHNKVISLYGGTSTIKRQLLAKTTKVKPP